MCKQPCRLNDEFAIYGRNVVWLLKNLSEFGFANMRYLVQPSDQPMRVAVDRRMRGEGRQQVKGTDRVLPAGANMERGTSTYFFGKVSTKAGDHPVLVYDASYHARGYGCAVFKSMCS